MTERALVVVVSIVVLGIGAQWIAWRLRLPSILLLLLFGMAAGAGIGLIEPDELFGPILLPLVSVSVNIVLFEGALGLRIVEWREVGTVVRRLVTIGVLATWVITTISARYLIGIGWELSALLGAMMVLTGPTVVLPLLRQVRPNRQVSWVLKWEGIVIDPVGAMLAVLTYEALVAPGVGAGAWAAATGLAKTIVIGSVLGLAAAMLMLFLLRRHWVPDFLQNPVTLMVLLAAAGASHLMQHESGLVVATVMGLVMANQRNVKVGHIIEFAENLRVLLLAGLFIVLAARLRPEDLGLLGLGSGLFIGSLIVVARPVAVALSTLGSSLSLRERAFISIMAPRGVVAAAVASLFALRMAEVGYADSNMLVPVTFGVVIATVAIYGLAAPPAAKLLGVAARQPQGVLMVGAHEWARDIAKAIKEAGFRIQLVDTNPLNVVAAKLDGLDAYHGSILSEEVRDELDLDGIGRLIALTQNDEVNALAALHFVEEFGRSEVYQLSPREAPNDQRGSLSSHLRARLLFGQGLTFDELTRRFRSGSRTWSTGPWTGANGDSESADQLVALFVVTDQGHLKVVTDESAPAMRSGYRLIALKGGVA